MNKEVHYEGWLIKSPPSKRIWRSRWRRRWFTLKQGEIPEQFCLEYYTDRNCRKLKGIIDLDQCEQVDCGLRLENRKQKFQFMFDIKTPKRTYYLAADSAEDMRDWVNCICQVCHLHDFKHSLDDYGGGLSNNKNISLETFDDKTQAVANNRTGGDAQLVTIPFSLHCNNVYQNSDSTYVNAENTSKGFSSLPRHFKNTRDTSVERTLRDVTPGIVEKIYLNTSVLPDLKENTLDILHPPSRKVPEHLILLNSPLLESFTLSVQPSPSPSTSSGPYIPISECFTGAPKYYENPTTPLNNLDPKFYDTPRSHNNIGLNLTNDKSYSPKITNCRQEQMTAIKNSTTVNNHSDSDSESVFTDDDDWTYPMPLRENVDRSTLPSDSSLENESFVLTYSQRFSKLPDDVNEKGNELKYNVDSGTKSQQCDKVKVWKNTRNLSLDIKKNERTSKEMSQLSDTENTSPAIGPKEASSLVEESYDIPRSHQLPYYNIDQMFKENQLDSKVKSSKCTMLLSSTVEDTKSEYKIILSKHFYTNAAPKNVEGNVFRYDFVDHSELPPVNRKLKPKISTWGKIHEKPWKNQPMTDKMVNNTFSGEKSALKPPSVDRNLKPNAFKLINPALKEQAFRRSTDLPATDHSVETDNYALEVQTLPRKLYSPTTKRKNQISVGTIDTSVLHQRLESTNSADHQTLPNLRQSSGNEHQLQYFDLDVANPPNANRKSISTNNLTKQESVNIDPLTLNSLKSGVVYNSVDFVKTEAFKRIREERKKESDGVNTK